MTHSSRSCLQVADAFLIFPSSVLCLYCLAHRSSVGGYSGKMLPCPSVIADNAYGKSSVKQCQAMQGSDKQSEVRIKKFMTMMDSMTEKELNTNDIKLLQQPSRMARISRGAGHRPADYQELLGETLCTTLHFCLARFCCTGFKYIANICTTVRQALLLMLWQPV